MIAAVTPAGVTAVCTGSLLLGAAGLLRGKRAACHWAFRELSPERLAIARRAAAALEGVSARANVRAGERAVC
jgi:transcriptional regulator GlxA family with amidase domain